MTVPAHEDPMDRPFSLDEFKATDVGQAAARAIERHADEIVRVADLGQTPLSVLISELEPLINERLQWVKVEWMIRDWLTPNFTESGRRWVSSDLPHKGFHYTRVLPDP